MYITDCNMILPDDNDKIITVQILYKSLRSDLSMKCDIGHVWEIWVG